MRGQVKEITDKIYDDGHFGLSYAEIEEIVKDVETKIKEENNEWIKKKIKRN